MIFTFDQNKLLVGMFKEGEVYLPDGYTQLITSDPRDAEGYDVSDDVANELEAVTSVFKSKLADYKISKMVAGRKDHKADPGSINPSKQLRRRLHKKLVFVKGRVVNRQLYERHKFGVYSGLVFNHDTQWIEADENPFLIRRDLLQWVTVNGEYGPHSKLDHKQYDADEHEAEGEVRRRNIVSQLKNAARRLGVLSQVKVMFKTLSPEIQAYKDTGNEEIISKIINYNGSSWLDQMVPGKGATIRQIIVSELTL